jgi:hypothetical protein
MRATLILCDYAAQDAPTGKVHMMGAGWSVTAPLPSPRAVAVFIKVGWTEANEPHKFSLRLVNADGQTVMAEGPAGTQPIEFQGNLEVGRPPGIPQGSEIDASFVVNLGPLPLVPGQRFTWQLEMDTQTIAAESFYVRPLPQLPPNPPA